VPVLMPSPFKVGIHPVHFGVGDDTQSDDRAVAFAMGMVLFVLVADCEVIGSSGPRWRSCVADPVLMSLMRSR